MQFVKLWWFLCWLRRFVVKPPPGKRGLTKHLGRLSWTAYRFQRKNRSCKEIDYTPCLNPKARYVLDSRPITWKWWKSAYFVKYNLDIEHRDVKWNTPRWDGHTPDAVRWLPKGYETPSGTQVRMTQRFGRQRSIRFMKSRSIIKHELAMFAAVDRAVAYARVSKPIKDRR